MQKSAFTMIELVFVIVVLGILASVAIPRLAVTRDDALIAKGKSNVAAIRSAIVAERQSRLFRGDNSYITSANMDNGGLFGGVLTNPITAGTGAGKWAVTTAGTTYTYTTASGANTFTYTPATGTFLCSSGSDCSKLTN